MSYSKPGPIPSAAFVPWTAVHFHTSEIRDRFLSVAAALPVGEVEAEPMPAQIRVALVRWRPGQFLRLNDIAYAHGGRIVVTASSHSAGHGHLSYPSK